MAMAGPNFYRGQYEFQCLHGMGEPLYDEVVGSDKLNRPCRIYAPVGTHETLLAYLVRRLLENGANSSFVNRIADEHVPIDELIADPVAVVRAMAILGNPRKDNTAASIIWICAHQLCRTGSVQRKQSRRSGSRRPQKCGDAMVRHADGQTGGEPVRNPADHRDQVGTMRVASRAKC